VEVIKVVHHLVCMGSYVDTHIIIFVIVDTNWNDGFRENARAIWIQM